MTTGADERRVRLQELINSAVASGVREIYTCIPAKVVKWDATKQRADCQILVKNVTRAEDDSREVNSWAVVPSVPVQFIGAGGYRITVPISDGTAVIDGATAKATTGTLFFAHRSMDRWLSGTGQEVDPELDHDHAAVDAVFVPGLMPFGSPWASCPTDHMTVGSDAGVQMHFHKDHVTAADTEGTEDFVAQAAKTKAWFDAFNAAVNAWTVVPQDGGAALKTALTTLIGGTPSTNVAAKQFKSK